VTDVESTGRLCELRGKRIKGEFKVSGGKVVEVLN